MQAVSYEVPKAVQFTRPRSHSQRRHAFQVLVLQESFYSGRKQRPARSQAGLRQEEERLGLLGKHEHSQVEAAGSLAGQENYQVELESQERLTEGCPGRILRQRY